MRTKVDGEPYITMLWGLFALLVVVVLFQSACGDGWSFRVNDTTYTVDLFAGDD